MVNKNIFVFLVFFMLTGCASNSSKLDLQSSSLNNHFVEVKYYDSEVFDYDFSSMLKSKTKKVKLILLSPVNMNSIPKRLDKWLASVNAQGGKIEVEIDPDFPRSKGLITEAIDFIAMSYSSIKESLLYSSVENYDIKIFYIEGKGIITKILFTHQVKDKT